MTTGTPQNLTSDWPTAGGEMAARIRDAEWATTALAPIEGWSERLKLMVEQVLASPLVASLVCGAERVLIYNDAAAKLYGVRHPDALGRPLPETFPEGWATVAPLYESAFAGEAVQVRGQPLDTRGEGATTDVFDALLTPVREADGRVTYVHMMGSEIGDRARTEVALGESEERQAFLLTLSDALRAEPDADAVANRATTMLFEQMRLNRCYIARYRAADDEADFPYQVGNDTVPPLPVTVCLSDYPDAYEQVLERTFVINDDFERRGLSAAERMNSKALGMRAMVASTVRRGEKTALFSLAAVSSRPRHWSPSEITLVEEAAERTWAAIERAQAEVAIRKSEQKFRALFDSIDEGLAIVEMIYDANGGVADVIYRQVNSAFERVGGVSNVVDRSIFDVIPGVEDHWLEPYKRVARTGTPVRTQNYQQDVDRWFDVYFTRVDEDERFVATVFNDITERKRAEALLRESEERQAFLLKLSDALRHVEEPFAILREACRILRRQLGAIRVAFAEMRPDDRTCTLLAEDVVDEAFTLVGMVADWDDFDPVALAASRKGQTFSREDLQTDADLSAQRKAAFASLNVRGFINTPLVKGGRLVAFFVAQFAAPRRFDPEEIAITQETAERTWAAAERARAEVALRESETRFRTVADNISQLAWTCDKLGDVTWYNKRWLDYTGLGFEEMKEWGWRRVQHPDHVDRVVAGVRQSRESGEPWQDTFPLRGKDGAYRWFLSNAFPIHAGATEIVRWFGTNTDITELREAHERQHVLVAELQHRTRNLMSVVRAMAEKTMARSLDLDDFRARFGDRLAALARVQGLLSRLVEGARITFDQLIRSELAAIGDEIDRVSLEGPDGIALRSSSVQTFALAIHELATNALKYGALGQTRGRLAITWRVKRARTDGRRCLHVDWRESGVTMPAEGAAHGDGAGRELIERALPYQLGARTTFVMAEDGVACTIALPVSDRQGATESVDA